MVAKKGIYNCILLNEVEKAKARQVEIKNSNKNSNQMVMHVYSKAHKNSPNI